eukprot:Platyproteum_vivax@DN4341_c0_g1_i2.p1
MENIADEITSNETKGAIGDQWAVAGSDGPWRIVPQDFEADKGRSSDSFPIYLPNVESVKRALTNAVMKNDQLTISDFPIQVLLVNTVEEGKKVQAKHPTYEIATAEKYRETAERMKDLQKGFNDPTRSKSDGDESGEGKDEDMDGADSHISLPSRLPAIDSPKSSVDEDAESVTPRKRGRPKKGPMRGRGRPKGSTNNKSTFARDYAQAMARSLQDFRDLSSSSTSSSSSSDDEDDDEPVALGKRPRGRPRGSLKGVPSSVKKPKLQKTPPSLKRGRGRPRKSQIGSSEHLVPKVESSIVPAESDKSAEEKKEKPVHKAVHKAVHVATETVGVSAAHSIVPALPETVKVVKYLWSDSPPPSPNYSLPDCTPVTVILQKDPLMSPAGLHVGSNHAPFSRLLSPSHKDAKFERGIYLFDMATKVKDVKAIVREESELCLGVHVLGADVHLRSIARCTTTASGGVWVVTLRVISTRTVD